MERVPSAVTAFSLSIGVRELCFAVEINGTSEFNAYSTEWTWSEVWAPPYGKLCVPNYVCCGLLDACNSAITTELLRYLREGAFRTKLLRCRGIAVESIDGGFELVWLNRSKSESKALLQPDYRSN